MVLKIQPEGKDPKTLFPSDVLSNSIYGFEVNDRVEIHRIKEAGSGKGYALFTKALYDPDEQEYCIMDFLWLNSKTGKTITQIFADPKIADDTKICLIIQTDTKTAVITSEECKGSRWEQDEPGELNFIDGSDPINVLTTQLNEARKKKSSNSSSDSTESGSPENPAP